MFRENVIQRNIILSAPRHIAPSRSMLSKGLQTVTFRHGTDMTTVNFSMHFKFNLVLEFDRGLYDLKPNFANLRVYLSLSPGLKPKKYWTVLTWRARRIMEKGNCFKTYTMSSGGSEFMIANQARLSQMINESFKQEFLGTPRHGICRSRIA